jgi:hypothetical protein
MIVSHAYESLMNRPGLVAIAQRNFETDFSTPKDYFAHAGTLAGMLLAGHPDAEGKARVVLDRESLQRIVDWLDTNAMFYGDYSWNKAEWRKPSPAGEKALREHIRKTFGQPLAEQPYAALVNVAEPSESRILKGPLAAEAGGWGQGAGKRGQSPLARTSLVQSTLRAVPANGDCPLFPSTNAPGFQRMRQLVEASIAPLEVHDIADTCGRDPCLCDNCWVRQAWSRSSTE